MKNLTSVEFLEGRIKSVRSRMEKLRDTHSLESRGAKLRNSFIARRKMCEYLEGELVSLKKSYMTTVFNQSKFGIELSYRIDESNTFEHRVSLPKFLTTDHITYDLYDYVNKKNIKFFDMWRPLSPFKALNAMTLNTRSIKSKAALESFKNELMIELREICSKFEMSPVVAGVSGISLQHMWLYCKLKKPKVYINKKGFYKKARVAPQGLFFEGSGYNVSEHWIIGSNSKYYPINFARKRNMPVFVADGSGVLENAVRINDIDLQYNYKIGHYNAITHSVWDDNIYNIEDMVKTEHDGWRPKRLCIYVESYQKWYPSWAVVQLSNGEYELESKCFQDSDGFHRYTDEGYSRCSGCGEGIKFTNLKVLTSPMNPEINASVCLDCKEAKYLTRMDYSTNVLDFKGYGSSSMLVNGQPVYLGLEFECHIDYNESDKSEVCRHVNAVGASIPFAVPTNDPSLNEDHGIEYIFRPEGLLQQKRNVHRFFQLMGDVVGHDAGDRYGLHIHISKFWLNQSDIIRLDNFVSTFDKYFRSIGGREENDYQGAKTIKKVSDLKKDNTQRYSMVNSGNDATVEFRFPKSLGCEIHICTNLELIMAVSVFCKYHMSSVKLNPTTVTIDPLMDFFKYVEENANIYPLLSIENSVKINLNQYLPN